MIFSQVKGHGPIIQNLLRALRSKTSAHALMFSGPSGVGKKLVARGWAQGLLCENQDLAPCGQCSPCLRVEKGQHPDLLILGPGESPTFKIEQVRDIQNFVNLRAFEGHAKVVILDEVQAMTAQAANSLLKTLEEPPAGSYFVLVTSNRAACLPTILSRCQKILFGALDRGDLKAILPNVEDWALDVAQGRVDAALRVASDETYKKWRQAALKVLRDLPTARTFEGFVSLEPLTGERDSALFATQCWAQWIRGATALKLKVGTHHLLPPDEKSLLEALSKTFSARALMTLGQKILRLEQNIQANINKSLAFEKFWIDAHRLCERGS